MATAPADPIAAPPAAVEPARPRMHSRLPSLDQLRASAHSKLGNLPALSTTNLPSGPSSLSATSPAGSSRLNRSLLARKESISSIREVTLTPPSSSSTSPSTTIPNVAGGSSPGGASDGGSGAVTPTNAAGASTKAMGQAAPERWKAVPTLNEIRQRVAHARTMSAASASGVGAVREEGADDVEVGGEGPMAMAMKKGPLADLARKEAKGEEQNPPPTPVPEFRVVKEEHPLGHAWTMTYSPPLIPPPIFRLASTTTSPTTTFSSPTVATPATSSLSDLYTSSLLHLGDFTTIESWARLSNHLSSVPPSCLSKGGNYHLFKKGIKPVFEDPANEKGGKWVLTLRSHTAATLDSAWRETILLLVGEALEPEEGAEEEGEEICGAVVSVRAKSDRIQLWTRSKEPVERINAIGKRFVKALGLEDSSRALEEGSFGLEFQYNHGSAPPVSKYITLSSATVARAAAAGPGAAAANGTNGTPAGGSGGAAWRSGVARS